MDYQEICKSQKRKAKQLMDKIDNYWKNETLKQKERKR